MKTIIKLVIIGLIAGGAYKYLGEKDIKIAEKVTPVLEWIIEKLHTLKDTSMQGQEDPDERNIYTVSKSGELSGSSAISESTPINKIDRQYSENRGINTGRQKTKSTIDDLADASEYRVLTRNEGSKLSFDKLDNYAKDTPAEAEVSLQSLVDYLIIPASNEAEKSRLLFTWVATHIAYDDHGYNTGNYAGCSPEEVIRNRVSVCEGYSNLLMSLGNTAGLRTIKIEGYAKGVSYRPGERFLDTNHAWNAMMIDGEWKLMDVTWAAGFGKGVNGRLVSRMVFDDYWFDVSPEEFIFTHLPLDDSWQLLENRLSKSLFESMPYAHSSYFKMGFNGSQCLPGVLNGSIKTLPMAYKTAADLKVISTPLEGNIKPGSALKLKVWSDSANKIALKNNGQWTYFEKEGNEFTTTVRAEYGELKLMANYSGDGLTYHTFLKYMVE